MKRVERWIVYFLCALLVQLGYNPNQPPAGVQASTSSVQMIDYNNALKPIARDDDYRTTYEIFVSSFCDSDGDGIGDLNGIRSKMSYIDDMGFDQIWLTPVHPSSTYHKYDVDDYKAIDSTFGTDRKSVV